MHTTTGIVPRSTRLQHEYGRFVGALGGTFVDSLDRTSVEVRFQDPRMAAVANAAFESTLDGVKLTFRDSAGTAVRGFDDGYAVLDAVSKMPGVEGVAALETMPMQMTIDTVDAPTRDAIDALLRPETINGHSISVIV